MSASLIESILAEVAPQLIDSAAASISCFRTYIITIPDTNPDQLKSYLKSIPDQNPTWQYWEERKGLPPQLSLGNKSFIQSAADPNDWTLILTNNDRGKFLVNWPQTIFISFAHRDQNYLIINSFFNKSQIVERGLLQNNCQTVIKYVYQYFQNYKIDLLPNIQQATYLQDKLSNYEKKLTWWQVALGLFVVTPLMLYLMYLYFNR